MNSRERFQRACSCLSVDRTPVWIMRQAGRYLPEYLRLKERYTFRELVSTPELATEVTLMPLQRFDFDAAIIFSDILIIPEALGQPYEFQDKGGISMKYRIDSRSDVAKLDSSNTREKLNYVADALRLVRKEIDNKKALIGFGGSPWTLAAYMLEGGSSKTLSRTKNLFYQDRLCFDHLLSKITEALIESFNLQIEAGVDALQIFDSMGSFCPASDFDAMSLQWVKQIVDEVKGKVPLIFFSKGMAHHTDLLVTTGTEVLSIDWTVCLRQFADKLPAKLAVQGNLNPDLLTTDPATVKEATNKILQKMEGRLGHIFNLGHGITPKGKIECVQSIVEAVHEFTPSSSTSFGNSESSRPE